MGRKDFVDKALSFLGTAWNTPKYYQILANYNRQVNLPREYEIDERDPWCAVFVSAIGIITNNACIFSECSCTKMKTLYKQNNLFYREVAFNELEEGDLIFYDWDGDNSPDHVGIITSLQSSGSIEVIEGNANGSLPYNGRVGTRMIKFNSPLIDGFAFPKFDSYDINDESDLAKQFVIDTEIFKGDENGYRWNEPITREETAIVLHRLMSIIEDMR